MRQEHPWTLIYARQRSEVVKNLDSAAGTCDIKVLAFGVLLGFNPPSAGSRGIFPDDRLTARRHDNAIKRHHAAEPASWPQH